MQLLNSLVDISGRNVNAEKQEQMNLLHNAFSGQFWYNRNEKENVERYNKAVECYYANVSVDGCVQSKNRKVLRGPGKGKVFPDILPAMQPNQCKHLISIY